MRLQTLELKSTPVRRGTLRNEFMKKVFLEYKNYITFRFRCKEKRPGGRRPKISIEIYKF